MSKEVSSKSAIVTALGNPWVASACLTIFMVIIFPAFAYYGHAQNGRAGILAAAAAGVVCWMGAVLALTLTALFRGTPMAIHGTLLSMIFRVGLPMLAGISLSNMGGTLAEGGVFGLIVGYYLAGLVVETLLSLRVVAAADGITKAT